MCDRMVHDYMVCSARLYGMLCTIIWYVAHESIRMHARSYTYARTYFSEGRRNRMQLLRALAVYVTPYVICSVIRKNVCITFKSRHTIKRMHYINVTWTLNHLAYV